MRRPAAPRMEDPDIRFMRALRFEKTGSLDNLKVQEMPTPKPGTGDVLVQVKAAAINPSDLKNVLGFMHITTLPRTPGRDFAGVVTEGPAALVGKSVFWLGRQSGFWARRRSRRVCAVPEVRSAAMPKGFSFEQAGAVGVAYADGVGGAREGRAAQEGRDGFDSGHDGRDWERGGADRGVKARECWARPQEGRSGRRQRANCRWMCGWIWKVQNLRKPFAASRRAGARMVESLQRGTSLAMYTPKREASPALLRGAATMKSQRKWLISQLAAGDLRA